MNVKKDIRFRVYVAFTCMCLLGAAVLIKAATIQVEEGPELRALSQSMHTRSTELQAERGNIYTEDGALLCSSIPQFDIHVDFSVIDKDTFNRYVDTLALCLSELLGDESASVYEKRLRTAYKKQLKYYKLKTGLAYYQYQAVRSFPIFNKGSRRGGFISESKVKRINPYGMLAYRTIGLWRENSQTVGMEATYDSVLQGMNGRRVEQKLTGGVWMPVEGSEVDPQNGRDIVTTIDIGIQDVAEHALMSILQQYKCQYGTCVVMEVKTGKIKALVNLGRQKDGSYWEDFNYALIPTEPGSTFKLVTLLALLSDKYVKVTDNVDAEGGAIRFGRRTMRDSHLGLHVLSIKEAFAQSSNAAMAKLVYQYYYKTPEKFIERLESFRIGDKTGIDIAGERRPLLKNPENKSWSATTLPWMATGYEVLISPLRTCTIYNGVANGGKMMKPYLVSAVREYGKNIATFEPEVVAELGDSSVIAQARQCLEEVAISGTAKSIQSPFYTLAGKTGTAQVADKGIKYSDGVYQGSFVGYFPANDPKYTIAVVIRTSPRSSAYYGGTIAAPVFRMIADKIFSGSVGGWQAPLDSIAQKQSGQYPARMVMANNYKRLFAGIGKPVAIDAEGAALAQVVADSSKRIIFKETSLYKGVMPDVTGMTLKDAVYVLEQQGVVVEINGSGVVRQQSVAAGNKIVRKQKVVLQLG